MRRCLDAYVAPSGVRISPRGLLLRFLGEGANGGKPGAVGRQRAMTLPRRQGGADSA
jgi:hypothetical protein